MQGRKKTYVIQLNETEMAQLRQIVASPKSPQGKVLRAKVILTSGQFPDRSDEQVAHIVGCSAGMVRKWRKRWVQTQSLKDAPRSGRPRTFSP